MINTPDSIKQTLLASKQTLTKIALSRSRLQIVYKIIPELFLINDTLFVQPGIDYNKAHLTIFPCIDFINSHLYEIAHGCAVYLLV